MDRRPKRKSKTQKKTQMKIFMVLDLAMKTPKTQPQRKGKDKLDFIKIKALCASENTVNGKES